MKTLILKTATEVEFFARGRKLADQGKRLAEEHVTASRFRLQAELV